MPPSGIARGTHRTRGSTSAPAWRVLDPAPTLMLRPTSSMASRGQRLFASASAVELRVLVEAAAVIAVTWLLLGWTFQRAITQADGSVLVVPFTQSALHAGFNW